VTRCSGRRYEGYLSLVGGVRGGIETEDPGGFHGLARGIAYFLVGLITTS